jgi:hypothetical protein
MLKKRVKNENKEYKRQCNVGNYLLFSRFGHFEIEGGLELPKPLPLPMLTMPALIILKMFHKFFQRATFFVLINNSGAEIFISILSKLFLRIAIVFSHFLLLIFLLIYMLFNVYN